MKATRSQKAITFTGISHESQLDDILVTASKTKCKCAVSDHSTKAVVTGNLDAFTKEYSK